METSVMDTVRQAQRGDETAFDVLVHQYQDRSVAYARTLLPDLNAAEDAAQEAFVQVWRDLPSLREPAAFPAFLRRIVFKYCDRARRTARPVVSLDAAGHITGGIEPEKAAQSAEAGAHIRAALAALPPKEREAATLYYLGENDLGEIAAFLELPRTTVKNRLHTARKRLRKELAFMAEEMFAHEKPSRNPVFAGKVLARLMEEFQGQMRTNPHAADRALLREGRETLDRALAAPELLDWETVRAGFYLLRKQDDNKASAALLMRYLAQPLDDSQTTWAYLHLANYLAISGSDAGAVPAFEAWENWLPGKNPRLCADYPNYPLAPNEPGEAYTGAAEVRLIALAQSGEFARAWRGVWREEEYFTRLKTALEAAPPLPPHPGERTLNLRFICLRMACMLCETNGQFAQGQIWVKRIYALAAAPDSEQDRAYWRAKALGHDINLHLTAGNDRVGASSRADDFAALLAAHPDAPWAAGEHHDLSYYLIALDRYADALPLLEKNLASGSHANAWGYAMHAGVVWQVTQDRARTLGLLRDAAVRDDRDLTDIFRARPEFAAIKDDPEFLAAIKKPI